MFKITVGYPLRHEQNGWQFAKDIFKQILLDKDIRIFINILH